MEKGTKRTTRLYGCKSTAIAIPWLAHALLSMKDRQGYSPFWPSDRKQSHCCRLAPNPRQLVRKPADRCPSLSYSWRQKKSLYINSSPLDLKRAAQNGQKVQNTFGRDGERSDSRVLGSHKSLRLRALPRGLRNDHDFY